MSFRTAQKPYTHTHKHCHASDTTQVDRSGYLVIYPDSALFQSSILRRCRFGGIAVLASRLSPSEMHCYAPPLTAGQYPLELSLNDQDYTDRRFPFLYFDDQASDGSLTRWFPKFSGWAYFSIACKRRCCDRSLLFSLSSGYFWLVV